jgi:hypothetical protein
LNSGKVTLSNSSSDMPKSTGSVSARGAKSKSAATDVICLVVSTSYPGIIIFPLGPLSPVTLPGFVSSIVFVGSSIESSPVDEAVPSVV